MNSRSKSKPKLKHAIQFLTDGINRSIFKADKPIPGIARLARMAGVSSVTMWKAVTALKEQGLLCGEPGHRLWIRQDAESANEAVPSHIIPDGREVWPKVRDHIEKDALNGIFPPGIKMPSIKELRNRYRVSYSVLRKALSALVNDGILVVDGRGYALPSLIAHHSTAKIVLVGYGWQPGSLSLGLHDEVFLRLLEAEVARAHLTLEIVVYSQQEGEPAMTLSGTGRPYPLKNDGVLGIVMLANAPGKAEIGAMLRSLSHIRKPIGIFDETGGWTPKEFLRDTSRIRLCYATHALGPSQNIARYLLALGHRKIAYVSPHHTHLWSVNRLKGLVSTFENAGYADGVVPFSFDLGAVQNDNRCDVQPVVDAYNAWKKKSFSLFAKMLDPVFHLFSTDMARHAERRYLLESTFSRAIADKEITAWVCVHDSIGLMALDFLAERDVKVPGSLSVVAFDDTVDAMKARLTSYNFNIAGAVLSILNHIVNYDTRRKRASIVEIRGMLVERHSSGKAPRLRNRA